MVKKSLDELLAEDDEFGLLDVKPLAKTSSTEDTRISQEFEEINDFFDKHGFAPGAGPADRKPSVVERKLQIRLNVYRLPDNRNKVIHLDRHGLLAEPDISEPEPKTLDDILDLDDDLLSDSNEEIFTMRNVSTGGIARPDRKSERKPCKDFERFKPLFDECAADLKAGNRKAIPFARELEIQAGEFFILNGVMAYVAEVRDPHIRNGKRNARLRLIFDTGTEGENLLRSLAAELYKDPDGRRITTPESGPLFGFQESSVHFAGPNDRVTGCIYVVKSLSPLPEIKKLDGNLFKIGFTTGKFEDRIRGAQDDPTFLMAPVHPVRTYEAINLNANKIESLLHRFFSEVRLDIEIKDRFGKPFRPREWFLLPLPVVEQAISMLLDGSIIRHRYDVNSGKII